MNDDDNNENNKEEALRSLTEVFPNEVTRMLFEHLSHQQRVSVSRVCSLWRFLVASFPTIPRYYSFTSIFASSNAKKGKFFHLRGVAVNRRNGNVFVLETGLNGLHLFDESGVLLRRIDLGEQLRHSSSIAVNSTNGSFAVIDRVSYRVGVFNKDAELLKKFGVFGAFSPVAVAINEKSGNILVLDTSPHVSVFDEKGNLLWKFDTKQNAEGGIKRPVGISINQNNGHIVIAEGLSDRKGGPVCSVFDEKGQFLFKLTPAEGVSEVATQQHKLFNWPKGVTFTQQNWIIVTDSSHKQIKVFDERGIHQFSSTYEFGEGSYSDPSGVTSLRNGSLAVCDNFRQTIQIFTPDFS